MKYCRTSNHQHLINLEESAAMTDSSFFAKSDTLISFLNNRTTPLTSLQESLDSLYRRRWTHEQIRLYSRRAIHCSDSFRLDVKGKPPTAVSGYDLWLRIYEQIIVHGLPFIGGFSANKGFCKRVFVNSGSIGRCFLYPLLVDFPPIKGSVNRYSYTLRL